MAPTNIPASSVCVQSAETQEQIDDIMGQFVKLKSPSRELSKLAKSAFTAPNGRLMLLDIFDELNGFSTQIRESHDKLRKKEAEANRFRQQYQQLTSVFASREEPVYIIPKKFSPWLRPGVKKLPHQPNLFQDCLEYVFYQARSLDVFKVEPSLEKRFAYAEHRFKDEIHLAEAEKWEIKSRKIQQDLDTANATIRHLREDKEVDAATIRRLQEEKEGDADAIRQLNRDNETDAATILQLNRVKETDTTTIRTLEAQMVEVEEERDNWQMHAGSFLGKNIAHTREYIRQSREMNCVVRRKRVLKRERDKLKGEIETANREIELLNSQIRDTAVTKGQFDAVQAEVTRLINENTHHLQALRTSRERSKAEIGELQQSLDDMKGRLTRAYDGTIRSFVPNGLDEFATTAIVELLSKPPQGFQFADVSELPQHLHVMLWMDDNEDIPRNLSARGCALKLVSHIYQQVVRPLTFAIIIKLRDELLECDDQFAFLAIRHLVHKFTSSPPKLAPSTALLAVALYELMEVVVARLPVMLNSRAPFKELMTGGDLVSHLPLPLPISLEETFANDGRFCEFVFGEVVSRPQSGWLLLIRDNLLSLVPKSMFIEDKAIQGYKRVYTLRATMWLSEQTWSTRDSDGKIWARTNLRQL